MQVEKYLDLVLKSNKNSNEVEYWIMHNLRNYLAKDTTVENQSQVEHIIDYLNSDKAPKRLRKMSYLEARVASERWLKALVKHGANLEEVEDVDYEVSLDFNDGFKLIKLKSELSYEREGSLMGHCVKSYFGNDSCEVYSLRDSRNMPHATLELPKSDSSKDFKQCKGKGNGPVHVKYIKYILDTFKHFGVSIRSSEMRYLGYQNLKDVCDCKDRRDWFKDNFSYSYIKLSGKKYIYLDSIKIKA